jgi:uncharacterized UPF0146 family protein
MARVTLHVIETDGSTSRTVEVGPGSRLEVAGPIAEGERVWILVDDVRDDER